VSGESKGRNRLLYWVALGFAVQIAAWIALVLIANANRPQEIPLHKSQSPSPHDVSP